MPYKKFTKYREGKKAWCTRNLRTGQIICYSSPEKRETGIRMREAFAAGWRPAKIKKKARRKNFTIVRFHHRKGRGVKKHRRRLR